MNVWKEEKGQSEWSSLYMILIFAIAALLIITLIKPFFRQSKSIAKGILESKPETK